jgi:hypothetical protein
VYRDRRAGLKGWLVNTIADALGLVALAVYAAGARIGEWLERTPREG